MKQRSKALQAFLEERDAFAPGNEHLLAEYLKLYRREYKRAWKRAKTRRSKTVKLYFSAAEYARLSVRARLYKMAVTPYAKGVIIAAQENMELIPNKDALLLVLQKVSMAISLDGHSGQSLLLLSEAEAALLDFLSITDKTKSI